MPGRVVVQGRVRPALAATPLIEEHDPIARRIEEAAPLGAGAATRPAVQEHHRLALRVAGLLVVDRVLLGDSKETRLVGLDLRIEGAAQGHAGAERNTRALDLDTGRSRSRRADRTPPCVEPSFMLGPASPWPRTRTPMRRRPTPTLTPRPSPRSPPR